jgi:ATP-binding cassette, subfamily B, bacterial
MDCGPTCLRMVAKRYGKAIYADALRQASGLGKEGASLLGISEAAEKLGFRTQGVKIGLAQLWQCQLPCILHWSQYHFVVLHKIKRGKYHIADPAAGLRVLPEADFVGHWLSDKEGAEAKGIALLLEPTPAFFANAFDEQFVEEKVNSFWGVLRYLAPYKKMLAQLAIGVLLGSALQLVLPLLTQSVVDVGINTQNIPFLYLVLLAQLALFLGRLVVDFIRSWILYHISSRINISILTDFLIKLMKLPVSYFETKKTGDILQRMNDHHRIQDFLTGSSLNTLFSVFNLIVFSVVLASFSLPIFAVFSLASLLYLGWIVFFLKRRKQLDYRQFGVNSAEQSKAIQLVHGMQEIKLHGCETQKRWEWERLQASSFRLGMKALALTQWQQTGAFFLNEGKNIIITFLAAKAVIAGQLTLGQMLAIQYIAGQLNGPIEQMIGFVQNWQLAKLSFDRLTEITSVADEEPAHISLAQTLPEDKTFQLKNVSFTYPGAGNEPVLQNISCTIPHAKVTAIVGASGSGKTTLLKLLLKFYTPQSGDMTLGGNNIENISHRALRTHYGVVMQESFVFSDDIGQNIAVGHDRPIPEKLRQAAKVANILPFVESLPLGFNTKIGAEGTGVSGGQKQRLLIARAVYKNPDIVLLDEATNALDANNERIIINNLNTFFEGRTTVIVAHRLSTVKHAHQIIVLNDGKITETGTHETLTALRGEYYTLVKNQLELGN